MGTAADSQTGSGSATPVPLAEVIEALAREYAVRSAPFREEWLRLVGVPDAGA